jgi:hypothetical protein
MMAWPPGATAIRDAVLLAGEEVEHRAVVPEGVRACRRPREQIRGDPVDGVAARTQPLLREGQGGRGEVEHGDGQPLDERVEPVGWRRSWSLAAVAALAAVLACHAADQEATPGYPLSR